MTTNDENKPYNYDRIEKAIKFIIKNFNQQPKLEEIAEHVNMSQFHFQRVFKDWAGVSPKKFLEYLTIQHAKKKLLEEKYSNTKLSQITGLSSPSRVHDLFINVEGMSPGEYKSKGKGLKIYAYSYETIFGLILIAATSKGICHAGFIEKDEARLEELKDKFPNAEVDFKKHQHHRPLLNFLNQKDDSGEIKLHLSGTPFQLKVWEALMTIPEGNLVSYSQVAQKLNKENATRAVASAIAKNPIAVLIPCHRVIQSTGIFGEYHWGKARKTALIGYEASKNQSKMKEHNYNATIKWTGNSNGKGTTSYMSYERSYEVIIANKKVIQGSSDPAFLGDQTKHNPEELFLASISSCHMLWFLHLCSKEGITVVGYRDFAEGKMIENKNGSGQFEEVVLKPSVIIKEKDKIASVNNIHEQANKMCFIANSCNFEIRHEPQTKIIEEQSN